MGKSTAVPEDKLALYEKLVATQPEVKRKGASVPYTSRNGHMFSFLTKEGALALRLPDDEREAFMAKYDAGPCIQYGRTMRGYVLVPDTLFEKTHTLKKYFAISYEYIGTLRPKPTAKKKKTGTKKAATKKKVVAKKRPTAKKKVAAKKRPTAKKKVAAKKRPTAKKKVAANKTSAKKKPSTRQSSTSQKSASSKKQ